MKSLRRLIVLALVLCAVLYITAANGAAISPGLEVLRAETKLVKCCVNGRRVGFSADEIEALTGVKLQHITVCSLPDIDDGVLKLAGVDVVKGQSISARGLQLLKFVPSSGFKEDGGFSFTVNGAGWESKPISCVIRFSETVNFAPIAVSSDLCTYKNVSVTKPLGTYDPDGDKLSYVIERYPTSGTVYIENGIATYTPTEGFVGADSFVYRAVDGYGQESDTALAWITVSDSKSGIFFEDMKENEAHLAAILVAENDIMTYTLLGDSYYFAPNEPVSRIDFAVMLVSAAGISVPNKQYPTDIFTDTATQSREKRLYLESAVTSGLIKVEGEAFCPNEIISVADAVSMTERALKEGSEAISSAYYEDTNGYLTKQDAAVMLSLLLQ